MPASLAETSFQQHSQAQCQNNCHESPGWNYPNTPSSAVCQGLRTPGSERALCKLFWRGCSFMEGRVQPEDTYKITAKGEICSHVCRLGIQMRNLRYDYFPAFSSSQIDSCCQMNQSIQWSNWSHLSLASCRSNSGWNVLPSFHLVGLVYYNLVKNHRGTNKYIHVYDEWCLCWYLLKMSAHAN